MWRRFESALIRAPLKNDTIFSSFWDFDTSSYLRPAKYARTEQSWCIWDGKVFLFSINRRHKNKSLPKVVFLVETEKYVRSGDGIVWQGVG